MKKDLKKLFLLLSASMLFSACHKKDAKKQENVIQITTEETLLQDIVVLDCEAYTWYTNKPNGANALYGKKLFIENQELNKLMNSTSFYKGLYEDESAFLGANYTSIQDEDTFVHSYDSVPLSSLEDSLKMYGLEDYIQPSYSNSELLELNRLLTISGLRYSRR